MQGDEESRIVDVTVVRTQRRTLGDVAVYTFVSVAYGCECHGYDARHWTTLCNN